ncbi:hypothetical protein ACUNWD_03365 [Sunxiuqinia sp. A32]|uniref:hypothetical protein n=1 Tax=Sunxiuqinia sp. A32 TaxID=3461496 RepID=UPI0040455692
MTRFAWTVCPLLAGGTALFIPVSGDHFQRILHFTYFGKKSRFNKVEMNNEINFNYEEKNLVFYNMLREMKRKRDEILEYFKYKKYHTL